MRIYLLHCQFSVSTLTEVASCNLPIKMLYLEDYLEMIEHLPSELRDRFTEMREMDLQVQNAMDSYDERVKVFFGNAKKLKPEQREVEYEKIRQDYYKALEDADEKVQLANQVYDLVDRYLRRLDQELAKFKMELEADNAGITEVLEKRSLELDNPPQPINHHRAEKRKYTQNALTNHLEKKCVTEKVLSSVAHEAARDVAFQRSSSNSSSPATTMFNSSNCALAAAPTPTLSYSLGQMGSSSNAIAAAASQAIAATQQMQQGRRTASLKASFEVMKNANADFRALIGRESLNGSSTTTTSTTPTTAAASSSERIESRTGRTKKSTTKAVTMVQSESQASDDYSDSCIDENGQTLDWTYDPNEPRYCICNQVSYGDMVACDNEDCPFEWFHYACVGITQPPKGKWYCPQCTAAMKRRQRNK